MSDPNTDPYISILTAEDPNLFIANQIPTDGSGQPILNEDGSIPTDSDGNIITEEVDTSDSVREGLQKQWSYATIAIEDTENDFSSETVAKRRVVVVTSAGTVTLPSPTEGIEIYIKKSNVAGTVTVSGSIDGASSVALNTSNYESLHLVGNGTEWMVL